MYKVDSLSHYQHSALLPIALMEHSDKSQGLFNEVILISNQVQNTTWAGTYKQRYLFQTPADKTRNIKKLFIENRDIKKSICTKNWSYSMGLYLNTNANLGENKSNGKWG
jgi:hypothetical protein